MPHTSLSMTPQVKLSYNVRVPHIYTERYLHPLNCKNICWHFVSFIVCSMLRRLRIGHSYLTHCYLLKGEPQPFCVSCNEALTINHLLTNCAEFADSRRKHYLTNTLEEVLSSGNYAHVLSFLKEINLYKKV